MPLAVQLALDAEDALVLANVLDEACAPGALPHTWLAEVVKTSPITETQ